MSPLVCPVALFPGVFWPGDFCPGVLLSGGLLPGGLLSGGLMPGGHFWPGGLLANFNAYTNRLGFLCLAS